MRKFLFVLCLIALITGCNDTKKQNELNEQKQYEATIVAENSPITVSELPFNFQFGMSRNQVDSLLAILVDDSTIRNYADMYYYDYKLQSGKTVETDLNFGFYNDSLYSIVFNISSYNQIINNELINEIDEDISSKLDSTYTKISHYEDYESGRMIFTKWFKGNQYIFLRKALFNDISFVNAPISKIVSDINEKKILDKIEKKGDVKVENSAWDGSVSQVKKYLKSNLKDPDSYESIEWGNVVETDNGYMVRHKYRAKNSFGGYMVENNVFYLDFQGNVISVSPY